MEIAKMQRVDKAILQSDAQIYLSNQSGIFITKKILSIPIKLNLLANL